MEHLTTIELARLVDEAATPAEQSHLDVCETCTDERAALRAQTQMLAALPGILPPKGDWRELEARLRSEGLVNSPGLLRKLGLARTPPWMRAAAAVLLFLGGTGTGATLASRGVIGSVAGAPGSAENVEQAASAVRLAEQSYVSAISRYRELMAQSGGQEIGTDPISRYAALEHLVLVSQAAVRQAPADPFLNGFLASALAERDAAARLVSTGQDNWF